MLMRSLFLLALALCLAAPIGLVGCGGDEPTAARRGNAKKKKKKKKARGSQGDMSKLPAKLKNVDWKSGANVAPNQNSRDPFTPYVEDLVAANLPPASESGIGPGSKVKVDVNELQLVAIISGTAVHKAMLEDASGLGHVVRSGDIIGREKLVRVTRITRNEIIFKPLVAPAEGSNEPQEVHKTLLTQAELKELRP